MEWKRRGEGSTVDFVSRFEAAEDGDGGFDGRFVDIDGLKTTFEGCVFGDGFAVFAGCGHGSGQYIGDLGVEK